MIRFPAVGAALLILGATVLATVGCAKASRNQPVVSFERFVRFETTVGRTDTAAPGCGTDCQKLRQEFRYVVYVGKQIYCYWDLKKADTGGDFDALAETLERRISDSTTATQYYAVLRDWAASFHDGHVNVLSKDDMTEMEIYSAPVRFEVLGPATDHETLIVTQVLDGADGVLPGDVVLAANGLPTSSALDRAEESTSGSTKRMRRFFAARRISDVLGIEAGSVPLSLDLQRGDRRIHVELPRTIQLAAKPADSPSSPAETGVSNFKATILPGGLGYLRIDGFSGTQSSFLLGQAMQRLSKTDGLLIDVRKNGGGDQSGNSVLARLISRELTRYRASQRMSDFVIASRPDSFLFPWTPGEPFTDWMEQKVAPAGTAFGHPVVVLTGPNCFSACDTFTSALKANKLATVAGEGTGGGTGTPLVFELPVSGHSFRYSVVRGLSANGEAIEGVGTLPDVVIEPTQAERIARKDQQLARALDVLKQQAGKIPSADLSAELARLPLISEQRLDVAPTVADELALRRIIRVDER